MGLIIVVLCTIPFLILYANRKRKRKLLIQKLQEKATTHGKKISESDIHGNFAIGLTEDCSYLIYSKKVEDTIICEEIDLSSIQQSSVVINGKITREGQIISVPDKIELVVYFIDKNKPEKSIEFYVHQVGITLTDERQLAEKWNRLINSKISN